jgi:hypothetical protein
MKRLTSLGDFISALYDQFDAADTSRPPGEIVTACTLDLLLRQRKRTVIAALLDPQVSWLH